MALGVPSLRLATRDSTDSGHCVETCLKKAANDQPCCKHLDDETGEPSTPEEADHKRVRMGTSSFNKQERLARKEVDEKPDRPEPAKRQRSVGDITVEIDAKVGKRANERETEDDMEFKRLSSEVNKRAQENVADPRPVAGNRSRSRHSSAGSGRSSPVQDRQEQMIEIPDEMRLAAGVAQDRRTRADRPARSNLFSSTEVLVEHHKTPTEETPITVNLDLEEYEQEIPADERSPPVAMPRTVTPDTSLAEDREEDSGSKKEDQSNEASDSDSKGAGHDESKLQAKGVKLGRSVENAEDKAAKPVEEEELKRMVRPSTVYQDAFPSSKIKMDKLEVFKEVLTLTPSKSLPEKREKQEEKVDVAGETIEKSHVDRCPCEGPMTKFTAPRITGEVTGMIEVGGRKLSKVEPVIDTVTESRPPPADASEWIAPSTSAAVSRARSEAAALPEAVRAVRAARRRDSGGPVAEVLSRDAAASSRLCASTGDLTHNTPRPDSPLGRTVSMQIGVGDQTDGSCRVSAAARARDQMDLSRLQEGYEVAQPLRGHIMSIVSSNESLDTESIQEEPQNAAGLNPPKIHNGTDDYGPEHDRTTAPAAVPVNTSSEKRTTVEITVNGIHGEEGHEKHKDENISRRNSEHYVEEGVGAPLTLPRIVQSELKRSSESDSSDGREELTAVSSSATVVSAVGKESPAPSVAPAVAAPPVVIESAPEHFENSSYREDTTTGLSPAVIQSVTAAASAQSVTEGAQNTGPVPGAGTAGEKRTADETSPVVRSGRGPPPTPPPRSPASRQTAPPAASRTPEQFEISALELDSVMISHEDFLRQEAERRAHVCRLAANFRTSREPSPAQE